MAVLPRLCGPTAFVLFVALFNLGNSYTIRYNQNVPTQAALAASANGGDSNLRDAVLRKAMEVLEKEERFFELEQQRVELEIEHLKQELDKDDSLNETVSLPEANNTTLPESVPVLVPEEGSTTELSTELPTTTVVVAEVVNQTIITNESDSTVEHLATVELSPPVTEATQATEATEATETTVETTVVTEATETTGVPVATETVVVPVATETIVVTEATETTVVTEATETTVVVPVVTETVVVIEATETTVVTEMPETTEVPETTEMTGAPPAPVVAEMNTTVQLTDTETNQTETFFATASVTFSTDEPTSEATTEAPETSTAVVVLETSTAVVVLENSTITESSDNSTDATTAEVTVITINEKGTTSYEFLNSANGPMSSMYALVVSLIVTVVVLRF